MPLPPRTEPVWAPPQTAWLPNDDADKDTDDLFRNLLNLHIDHQLPHSNQPLRPAVEALTNPHQPVHALRDHIPSDTDVLHVPDIHPEADALHMFASAPMSVTAAAPVPLRPRAHVDYDLRRMRARAPSASPSHTPSPSSSPPPSLSAPRIKNELYKTEICRSFAETAGFCKYGSKCQFAHGEQELRPVRRHPRYKTKLCRNFVTTGTCPYDARCRFIHASDLAYAPLPVTQRRDTFSPVGVNTSVAISMAPAPMAVTPVPVTAVPVPAAPDKYADALQVFLNGPRYELEAQRDDRVAENGYDANANLFTDYATHTVERFEGAPLERLPVSRRMFANNGAQAKLPSLVPRTAVPMPPPQRRLPVFRNMPHTDDQ